jgi:hypothetical protein
MLLHNVALIYRDKPADGCSLHGVIHLGYGRLPVAVIDVYRLPCL